MLRDLRARNHIKLPELPRKILSLFFGFFLAAAGELVALTCGALEEKHPKRRSVKWRLRAKLITR